MVRLAAHVSSGFKSRLGDLCKSYTSSRQRQLSSVRKRVKGPSQISARNESERDSADTGGRACHKWRSPAQGKPRDVIGVGMIGTETCVTGGDLVCSATRRPREAELLSEG